LADASFDVAIIGGGIVGVSAAALLAGDGLRVALFERQEIAAAASGRNSGAVQHPFDPYLAALHRDTVAIYRDLGNEGTDFQLPAQPAGLLLLSSDEGAVAKAQASIREQTPDLEPTFLGHADLRALEPSLAPDLVACRLATGYPVAPAAATNAVARRARERGAVIEVGEAAQVVVIDGRAAGVRLASGRTVAAGRVLVAAGPWTPSIVPGWVDEPPIRRVWGVVVSAALENAPAAVLEELGIDRPGPQPEELFSLVTAGGDTSVGSTFLADEPDLAQRAAAIIARASRYVPALADVQPVGVRACARPVSFDGRPLIGAVPGVDNLFVCAGHGPWGISTGPASARMVVDEMLGRGPVDRALSAARYRG
jgi:glycine/D-amino acid oxidase-like deaminating enzyme